MLKKTRGEKVKFYTDAFPYGCSLSLSLSLSVCSPIQGSFEQDSVLVTFQNTVTRMPPCYLGLARDLPQSFNSKACKARVFRPDIPPTRSRRSTGSGGESSSMLTSVEGNAVQGRMLL
jgi:hypothetical protein